MAAQIAASDHGSPHRAETPDDQCSSAATIGWNRIQGAGSINFLLLPWALLCGEAPGIIVRLAGSVLARSKNCTFLVSFRVIARVAYDRCEAGACAVHALAASLNISNSSFSVGSVQVSVARG